VLIKRPADIRSSEITSRENYLNRRDFIRAGAIAGSGLLVSPSNAAVVPPERGAKLTDVQESEFSTDEAPTSYEDVTTYNNFYEFGTDKGDPKRFAGQMTTDPWSVRVDGMVDRPGNYDFGDITRGVQMEERIYRLRCVEAWSMVIPWVGFELKDFLDRVGVQPGAKYVAFETLVRPSEMPGVRRAVLEWPYREGLRLDEAMHPLTILATGLYGEEMPNQNGAPIRLVVPWKYGFKSIKSIVRITLTDPQPPTSWNMSQPREYGFYSNVNPEVDHPRWSQATERRVGGGLLARRIPTRMFNGYEAEVADLYRGMDLAKFY